jgi:EAL domain-containing protein (putative c-di-GMP-specific phosphodiesterase class I)
MRELADYQQSGRRGTLLLIELNGPPSLVPIEAEHRIQTLLPPGGLAAPLDDDNFAVVTTDRGLLAYALATRLAAALSGGRHASIGLAELTDDTDPVEAFRQADLACKRARQLGSDRVEWYDSLVEEQFYRRADLVRHLPGAAERGEFELVFQPIVDLGNGRPVGLEALLRWRHPLLGTIYPAELFPVAWALGLAADVDRWVFAAVRRLGVRTALNGGRTLLTKLRSLPVDVLKLDASLAGRSRETAIDDADALTRAAINLGRRLGLEIVVTGLETDEQVERARGAGCRLGQGFALGRPASVEAYLNER